jgi:hypothetical protein
MRLEWSGIRCACCANSEEIGKVLGEIVTAVTAEPVGGEFSHAQTCEMLSAVCMDTIRLATLLGFSEYTPQRNREIMAPVNARFVRARGGLETVEVSKARNNDPVP